MLSFFYRNHNKNLSRAFIVLMQVCFVITSLVKPSTLGAQTVLTPAGQMLNISESYVPAYLWGMSVHPENPLVFDFLVEKGDSKLDSVSLQKESLKLTKYFLAALTIPVDEQWVNLSPYEKNRIIPDSLGRTEMGRELLAQDYLLKQLTSSLIYPEKDLGKKFWDRVRKAAFIKYGSSDIETSSFNKVWIVPDKAVVVEKNNSVIISECHLKVMLEEDFMARLQALEVNKTDDRKNQNSGIASQIVREIILPEIEKEVNTGKNFSSLRQVYFSMILAAWYKQALKESLLSKIYAGKAKTKGVETFEKEAKQKIYAQYLEAFKKGAYNIIKEEFDPATDEIVPRKYFSGGMKGVQNLTSINLDTPLGQEKFRGTVNIDHKGGSSSSVFKIALNDVGVSPKMDPNTASSAIFGDVDKWLKTTVSPQAIDQDMFADYDYRSMVDSTNITHKGKVFKPEVAFRFGIVWADKAIQEAEKTGITDRTVLLARDARKIEPELIDALAAGLKYRGLNVVYIADQAPNCVTSYSWAVQQLNPLMSIFVTASHVSKPENIIVRGFKVAVLREKGADIESLSTREIKIESRQALMDLVNSPEKITAKKASKEGAFSTLDVTENSIRFNTLVGKITASDGSLLELRNALRTANDRVAVLDQFEARYANIQNPLQGLKVVVEGSNTPSGQISAETYRRLGAEVVLLHGDIMEVSGEHTADPSNKANLADLETAIKENNAHFGIAFDLDGDRGYIDIPIRESGYDKVKFVDVAPDNAIVLLLPKLVKNWGYNTSGVRIGTIRDVLGTFGVNDIAEKLNASIFQTDAGYVFLKALKKAQEKLGFIFPIFGERSGHTWMDVSGPIENPLAVAVSFASMLKSNMTAGALNPVFDLYRQNTIAYSQSPRFMPFFHPDLLARLSADPRNDTGWKYDPQNPVTPPKSVIALGKDFAIAQLKSEFIVGKEYQTPAGLLKVSEFNQYQDKPEDGGLYRFADIIFELNGKFAGRFVFRASSNDPAFVASYEALGEESPDVVKIRQSVSGVVFRYLVTKNIAILTSDKMDLVEKDPAKRTKQFEKSNLPFVEHDFNAFLKGLGQAGVASSASISHVDVNLHEIDVDDDTASSGVSSEIAADNQRGKTGVLSTDIELPAVSRGSSSSAVGGINLNPKLLDMQIKRDKNGSPLPMFQQIPENLLKIQGFVPFVIQVLPANQFPLLSQAHQSLFDVSYKAGT